MLQEEIEQTIPDLPVLPDGFEPAVYDSVVPRHQDGTPIWDESFFHVLRAQMVHAADNDADCDDDFDEELDAELDDNDREETYRPGVPRTWHIDRFTIPYGQLMDLLNDYNDDTPLHPAKISELYQQIIEGLGYIFQTGDFTLIEDAERGMFDLHRTSQRRFSVRFAQSPWHGNMDYFYHTEPIQSVMDPRDLLGACVQLREYYVNGEPVTYVYPGWRIKARRPYGCTVHAVLQTGIRPDFSTLNIIIPLGSCTIKQSDFMKIGPWWVAFTGQPGTKHLRGDCISPFPLIKNLIGYNPKIMFFITPSERSGLLSEFDRWHNRPPSRATFVSETSYGFSPGGRTGGGILITREGQQASLPLQSCCVDSLRKRTTGRSLEDLRFMAATNATHYLEPRASFDFDNQVVGDMEIGSINSAGFGLLEDDLIQTADPVTGAAVAYLLWCAHKVRMPWLQAHVYGFNNDYAIRRSYIHQSMCKVEVAEDVFVVSADQVRREKAFLSRRPNAGPNMDDDLDTDPNADFDEDID
jgi:hypothetical protein